MNENTKTKELDLLTKFQNELENAKNSIQLEELIEKYIGSDLYIHHEIYWIVRDGVEQVLTLNQYSSKPKPSIKITLKNSGRDMFVDFPF